AQAPWSHAVSGVVLALVAVRALAKITGLTLASFGSGMRLRQALWVGCAMSPMSSVALLLASQFASASPTLGPSITSIALPAILLMEVLGGLIATMALHRAGETSRPWLPGTAFASSSPAALTPNGGTGGNGNLGTGTANDGNTAPLTRGEAA
ncbi:MAG: sodium:proton exchanger, partial [Rhodoferax sp.]|nr:sodium:proton exchanger [Rhodoferax sp.]